MYIFVLLKHKSNFSVSNELLEFLLDVYFGNKSQETTKFLKIISLLTFFTDGVYAIGAGNNVG